jgi:uncharacterized protein YraI
VGNSGINIREGPGTQYPVRGGLTSGTCVTILGRNEDSSWFYMTAGGEKTGWVAAWLLNIDGLVSSVSVITVSEPLAPIQQSQDSGSSSGGSSSDSGHPAGATAICNDGTYSFSANRRGTCSHHGGVAQWLP